MAAAPALAAAAHVAYIAGLDKVEEAPGRLGMVTVRQSRTRRTCRYRWIMVMTTIERLGLHLVLPLSL